MAIEIGKPEGCRDPLQQWVYTTHCTTRYQLVLRSRCTMTALRTIVGACNKYVKALKKKLAVKRDDRRRCRRHELVYAVAGATPVDELLQRYDYYDNEAVDNMINEFIDNKQKATTGHRHQTS
ncbi:Uncharacterized protein FWK35_00008572 [Aphis craccivora]|uniref:Uncharacterized protein n=1 Tax=Aphis craccivora TaxID=307492 RepID=A0A6G0ZLF7_APHCR|nr:Uncharacterized protein FWK35_00008572 [Aphis craccivora]